MDGRSIDMTGLLRGFQEFWAEKSENFLKGLLYLEAGPHLLLSAFLKKVVNGGAVIIEEYGLGLGRVDLNIRYAGRNYPIEIKLRDSRMSRAARREQLLGYMDRLLAKEGWLLEFDRKSPKSWDEKISWDTVTETNGHIIHLVGC
jgi:hypothetical protein